MTDSNTTALLSKMYSSSDSSNGGSTDRILKNILSSVDQPVPLSSSSSTSMPSTDRLLLNIERACLLPSTCPSESSPSDVSLSLGNKERNNAPTHLKEYQELVRLGEPSKVEASSEEDDYQPPSPTSEVGQGDNLNLDLVEEGEWKAFRRTLGKFSTPNPKTLILNLIFIEFFFIDPMVLALAYEDLPELRNKKWITNNCIDPWLLNMGKTMLGPKFRYIPTFFIPPVGKGEASGEEVDRFRKFFGLPEAGNPCPLEDALYVLNTGPEPNRTGNHFCTVAFMPSSRLIYILGRRYNENKQNYHDTDWKSWDGIRIWTRVCSLFGWNEDELGRMRLCSVNWSQNGYDCGPIACQIVWHLMTYGLRINRDLQWNRPNMPCCHALRKTMAQSINGLIVEGIERFGSLDKDRIREMSDNVEEFDSWNRLWGTLRVQFQLDPASVMRVVVDNIDKAMMKCLQCQDMLDEVEEREQPIY